MAVSIKDVGTFDLHYFGSVVDPENPKKIILGFFSEICLQDNQGSFILTIDQILQKNADAQEEGEEGIQPNWKSKVDKDAFTKKWSSLLIVGQFYQVRAAIDVWSNGNGKGVFYKIMKARPLTNSNNNGQKEQQTFKELEKLVET